MTDWSRYQKCRQVCGAEAGEPCLKLYGIVAGVCEIVEEAEEPHSPRELTAAAARAGGDRG